MKSVIRPEIQDVTDTAIWVAAYRAEENNRKDALFKDPFAQRLIGESGTELARRTQGSRYTAWSVVIRTFIIDQFIKKSIDDQKVNVILNLGAGLDSRAYRMDLPSSLRFIEVDFDKIINYKSHALKEFTPRCLYETYSFDLLKSESRNQLLEKINLKDSDRALVLTEGVIPYFSNEDADQFVNWLYKTSPFKLWITEYYSPEILNFLRTPKRLKQMKDSPFLFAPNDWFGFFKERGWEVEECKYFGEVSEEVGRTPPSPSWLNQEGNNSSQEAFSRIKKFLGYALLEKI